MEQFALSWNCIDQYFKTMQSYEFHYHKLNCTKIIWPQHRIFSYKKKTILNALINENFRLYLIKQGVCICDETSHLESYKFTEYAPYMAMHPTLKHSFGKIFTLKKIAISMLNNSPD